MNRVLLVYLLVFSTINSFCSDQKPPKNLKQLRFRRFSIQRIFGGDDAREKAKRLGVSHVFLKDADGKIVIIPLPYFNSSNRDSLLIFKEQNLQYLRYNLRGISQRELDRQINLYIDWCRQREN